jgi:hypothetical protein
MDDSVKMLIEAASEEFQRELFQRTFNIEDACGVVSAFMFHRYGVSNYICGADVKKAIADRFDAHPGLQRATPDTEQLTWKPMA